MREFSKRKQRCSNSRIFGFDIETYDNNKKFLCASIFDVKEDCAYFFKSKRELIDFIRTKDIFNNSIIAATNLSFDFIGLMFNEKEIAEFDTVFRGSDLILAKTYVKGGMFSRRYVKNSKKIQFIDTMNYSHMSVESIGKIINIGKIEHPEFLGRMPKNESQWEEMKRYNIRDSEISGKYIEFLYDAFTSFGASHKITIASTAMSLFQNKYLDKTYFRHDEDVLLEQFEGYYGGRTEAFMRGRLSSGWRYYDINSLYPWAMCEEYPDPNHLRITYRDTQEYIDKYHGISKVDIFCPNMKYPLLPHRIEDKLIFPIGYFTGWYSHIELRRAKALGYQILKVHKTHYYKKSCRPFKAYVMDMYEARKRLKAQDNPMEFVVKILMNSLYGKFGQKFTGKDDFTPFNHTQEQLDKLKNFERIGDFLKVKKDYTKPPVFCFPIWSLHVTAYGRIKLHEEIVKHNAAYCDTDSIITRDDIKSSKELGEFKKEYDISSGLIIKPKFYALNTDHGEVIRIKGIAKKLFYKEFEDMLKNPKINYLKFMRLRESIRRGFLPNEIVECSKELSLEDDKRIWPAEFNPAELQDSRPRREENANTTKDERYDAEEQAEGQPCEIDIRQHA